MLNDLVPPIDTAAVTELFARLGEKLHALTERAKREKRKELHRELVSARGHFGIARDHFVASRRHSHWERRRHEKTRV